MSCARHMVAVLAILSTSAMSADAQSDSKSAGKAKAAAANPVVVELFTSQGCSSCPPADRLLAGVNQAAQDKKLPIYCLSFHVDYWNSLGWTDPYSSKAFTQRQYRYAAAFESRGVYTPQMIVNGKTEFVGSRGQDAQAAISESLSQQSTATVKLATQLSANKRAVTVSFNLAGNGADDLLNVALVQSQATNSIPRGENSGRQLSHVHVVRDFKTISAKLSANGVRLEIPSDLKADHVSVIAYLQDGRSMQITGAGASEI